MNTMSIKKRLLLRVFLLIIPFGLFAPRNPRDRLINAARVAKNAISEKVNGAFSHYYEKTGQEMRDFAAMQWNADFHQRFLRSHVNMTVDDKPQFIAFFAHGYRPTFPGFEYARGRFNHHLAPFLKKFRYVAYHPSLKVGPKYTSFGQDDDIAQVKYHLDKIIEMTKDSSHEYYGLPILASGHSNGAATTVTMFGAHPELGEHVSGIILFAPYTDIRRTKILNKPILARLGGGAVNSAPSLIGQRYDLNKKAPIDYVTLSLFPHSRDIFLIHARNDTVIPFGENYVPLVEAFKRSGYSDLLHLHPFETGGHGSFSLKANRDDKNKLGDDLTSFVSSKVLRKYSGLQELKEMMPVSRDF
jgi:predicted esterase